MVSRPRRAYRRTDEEESMIEINGLTKRYGPTTAVHDLTFTVQPGAVTGFLGPNGAGKSTTMRMILGLDAPTEGTVTVLGKPYRQHIQPLHEVGALLEARGIHPGRSAWDHLWSLAQPNRIPKARVHEVLDVVGLTSVAKRRAGSFSLGMGQRLGIAAALLGDPEVLLFDEPVNGLDPEGIIWIRTLIRSLAAEGRTIFVSSHLMSEMALTADHLIVIGRGELIADASVDEFVQQSSRNTVRVHSPRLGDLATVLAPRATDVVHTDGALVISGLSSGDIGDLALAAGIAIHQLIDERASLEEAFLELTQGAVDYRPEAIATDAERPAPPATPPTMTAVGG
jgi:ABC-2 type transport system ATP-binding protein